ncbi:MAG: HNH endonuclease [Pyrinomonadaceae bacterium]|nr:HNH endonuclease [Pyrinomonadaceae bacterium]
MTKRRVPAKQRRLVRQRAESYCEYCICPEFCATQLHSIEHITPESPGGTSTEDNLALACQGCNGSKSNKTQAFDHATRRRVSLFHPRRGDWHDHFVWSRDHLLLIGLTPTGRATIRELDLNRAGVVHLRRLLLLNREHPPSHRSSSE